MLRFVIRRLVVTLPMVLVVVSLTWALIRLAPGNFYTGEKVLPPAIEQNIREKYGLDQPWYVQYGAHVGEHLTWGLREFLALPGPVGQRNPEKLLSGIGEHRHCGLSARSGGRSSDRDHFRREAELGVGSRFNGFCHDRDIAP